MEITLNGEKKHLEKNTSVAVLLTKLGIEEQPIAVELNGHVVKKQNHAATLLNEADKIEIVCFVGGG
jgi:sulfur carrier protein